MPWSAAPSPSAPACRGPEDVVLPPGSRLDAAYVFDVATRTNAAHAALGTELLGVFAGGVALRVRWRSELDDGEGGWAPGVISELLDHACSLAAMVALGSVERFGATMSLRVEHTAAARRAPALVAVAVAPSPDGDVVRVDGRVCTAWPLPIDPPGAIVATGRGTVVVGAAGPVRR